MMKYESAIPCLTPL